MPAPTRRGILSAMAIAPVVIAAPAVSANSDWVRVHRAWVEAHSRVQRFNKIGVADATMDDACEREGDALAALIAAPAPNGAAVGSKITALLSYHEGGVVPERDLALIAQDAARLA